MGRCGVHQPPASRGQPEAQDCVDCGSTPTPHFTGRRPTCTGRLAFTTASRRARASTTTPLPGWDRGCRSWSGMARWNWSGSRMGSRMGPAARLIPVTTGPSRVENHKAAGKPRKHEKKSPRKRENTKPDLGHRSASVAQSVTAGRRRSSPGEDARAALRRTRAISAVDKPQPRRARRRDGAVPIAG